jgi:hypothetical protein
MAVLVFSRMCGLALVVAMAGLPATSAEARSHRLHHHRLPHKAPVPALNQQVPQPLPAAPPLADVPVPEPRPADAAKPESSRADMLNQQKSNPKRQARPEPSINTETEPEPPAIAPTPPEKPAEAQDKEPQDKKMLPDPRSASLPEEKMPQEELACRERLKTLGVTFEERKVEHDEAIGCSIPYPIVLKTLGKSIDIVPATELNCQMAEAAARFAADVIQPAAKAEFAADLKSISQASAFVCRPRHGTRKLSEHAFGNALDIASFTLSDGKKIEVGPVPPEKDAKFLNAVRKAACGPFKTVLGPGADADHALHFHLDLEPRRHGGTFCQ